MKIKLWLIVAITLSALGGCDQKRQPPVVEIQQDAENQLLLQDHRFASHSGDWLGLKALVPKSCSKVISIIRDAPNQEGWLNWGFCMSGNTWKHISDKNEVSNSIPPPLDGLVMELGDDLMRRGDILYPTACDNVLHEVREFALLFDGKEVRTMAITNPKKIDCRKQKKSEIESDSLLLHQAIEEAKTLPKGSSLNF